MSYILNYPKGINSGNLPYMKFIKYEYSLPKLGESNDGTSNTFDELSKNKDISKAKINEGGINKIIHLPVPPGIGDSLTSNWESENIAPIKTKYGSASEMMTDVMKTGADIFVGNEVNKFAKMLSGLAEKITDVNALESAYAAYGKTIRPNAMKVYKNGDFRSASFDYEMYPKSADEASQVQQMVEEFKECTIPLISHNLSFGSGLYYEYEYPAIFDIMLFTPKEGAASSDDDFLLMFEVMALTSFSVSYSGDSEVFTVFRDGQPLSTKISLQFTSLFPIARTSTDFFN